MSLDVTYHCEALTTADVWDHQLCSSILSMILLTDGDEMFCCSLITLKATLEDELKKARFMEHADGTTHLCSKGFTYTGICDLAETWYQEPKCVDMILLVLSLYLLRSNNSMMQTSQLKKHNNQTGSTLVLQTTLLPLLQVLNSLEVLVF